MLCGTVKPSVWMSEDIAMCVEGSSCYTWRAEWCEQEVTWGFCCVQGFVNSSRARDFNLSETSFNSIIKDSLSGPPQLSWWSLPEGDPNCWVTVQIIWFWPAKGFTRTVCWYCLWKRGEILPKSYSLRHKGCVHTNLQFLVKSQHNEDSFCE